MPTFLWDKLSDRSVLLYGVGDGADKILALCKQYSVKVAGIFVSDSFFAEKSFQGFTVMRRSEALGKFPDTAILLCFGIFREDDIADITALAEERELYAPDVPLFGSGICTYGTLKERKEDIKRVYDPFDKTSKSVFENILRYKISGDIKYLSLCESERKKDLKQLFCLPEKAVYADLGAYRGDTIEEYISVFGHPFKVYAFEPAAVNYRKLKEKFGNCEGYHLINAATSNINGEISFSDKSGRGAHIGGNRTVTALTLDSCVNEKIDYLKIDVEGAESDTLKGAERILREDKPFISLSVYHRTWDFIDLAISVLDLGVGYKIHLRHHPYIPAWDTMLYCTP